MKPGVIRTVVLVCSAAAATGASGAEDAATQACGNPFKNHFGPFDYRKAPPADLDVVQRYHFTPGVESLTRPLNTTAETMAGDVGYVLHVFPNHARALLTMARLGERHKTDKPPAASFSVECYFQRAVRFAPDDTVARGLYAHYLFKKKRKADAIMQLEAADEAAKDDAIAHSNIGLNYFEMGEYDRAAEQARKAQELGLERQELIDLLKTAGKWQQAAQQQPAQQASN